MHFKGQVPNWLGCVSPETSSREGSSMSVTLRLRGGPDLGLLGVALDHSTVFLHSPPEDLCKRVFEKKHGNSHRAYEYTMHCSSPRIHCRWCYTQSIFRPLNHDDTGHVLHPTDSPKTNRLGLFSRLGVAVSDVMRHTDNQDINRIRDKNRPCEGDNIRPWWCENYRKWQIKI